jgi:hypothetical protein
VQLHDLPGPTFKREFFAMTSINIRNTIAHLVRATLLASLTCIAAAQAAEPASHLVLSVNIDTPAADRVLAGDYDAAIKRLGTHGFEYDRDPLDASSNLCVAYIMKQKWTEAETACHEAISRARASDTGRIFYGETAFKTQFALAYSNLAVLEWLQNYPDKATHDVNRAHRLSPRSPVVAQNWTVLNATPQPSVGTSVAAIQH